MKLIKILSLVSFLVMGSANAGLITQAGVITGFEGLMVGSKTYDINFIDYDSNDPSTLATAFATEADAEAAGSALASAIDGLAFDITTIRGCGDPTQCWLNVHYNGGVESERFRPDADNIGFVEHFATANKTWGLTGAKNSQTNSTGTQWTEVIQKSDVANVPEPATFAIFALGLFGLVARRKLS